METSRQFALGLLVSTLAVAGVGFVVYIDNPTPLQPYFVHQSASVLPTGSRVVDATRDRDVHQMLVHFVGALERDDLAAMRSDFPSMTRREARVLRGIRRRLGENAKLSIGSERVIGLTAAVADLDFEVLARVADTSGESRLPFHATLRKHRDTWLIEELNQPAARRTRLVIPRRP